VSDTTIKTFDLEDWKRRFEGNSSLAESNSLMDSGWSERTANRCVAVACGLFRELAEALAAIETKPEDLFDRPVLTAVQEAARFATREATR
jgi:hypothetical protein